jgi:hypothetical protein
MTTPTFDVAAFSTVADAVAACAAEGGGQLFFSRGVYESGTIRLPNNIHLRFEAGAVLKATEGGFDEPEESSWEEYQDFGHSHFNNGLLVADGVENITISGPGLITGDGRLRADDSSFGGIGGKLVVLKECRNVTIRDIALEQGGHFTILANDVDGLELSNLRVEGQRDGANIIGCRNVTIRDSAFSGHDDALVFKSDYALGRSVDSENVDVRNCTLSSRCNALQFGTETVGAFRNMHFENIRCIRGAKAAIGILSCDGAIVEDMTFKNIVLEECSSFFFIKIDDRGRRPDYRKGVDTGSIRRLSFTNIKGVGPMSWRGFNVTPTIMGLPHRPIEDLTFTDVHLTVPGGHPAEHADSTVDDTGFFMARFRTDVHPSYGWWMRDVKNITFNNCSVTFAEPDGRPAVVVEDGRDIAFRNFSATRSAQQDYDIRVTGDTSCEITDSEGLVCTQSAHEQDVDGD